MSGGISFAEHEPSLGEALFLVPALGVACVVAMYVAVMALLLFHETIHALTARMLGLTLVDVAVGTGRTLLRWQAFGCEWVVRWLPTHGLVHVLLPTVRWFRTRLALVHLSAPVVCSALCTALVLECYARWEDIPALMYFPVSIGSGYITLVTAINLLPISLRAAGVLHPTDVLAAWRLMRLSKEQITEAARAATNAMQERRRWELFLAGRAREALQEEQTARAADPSSASLMMTLLLWAAEGADAALAAMPAERAGFAQRLKEQRRRGAVPTAELDQLAALVQLVLDVNEAFFSLHADRPELLPVADALTGAAMARDPRNPGCVRTRGLLELYLGNVAQGLALLRRAWRAGEPPWLRALCACYLALGHAMRGEAKEAREFLRKARRLHEQCLLLARYTKLVETALARTAS